VWVCTYVCWVGGCFWIDETRSSSNKEEEGGDCEAEGGQGRRAEGYLEGESQNAGSMQDGMTAKRNRAHGTDGTDETLEMLLLST
jgi:hypothetical protein